MDLDKIKIGGKSLAELLEMILPFIQQNAQPIAIGAAIIAAALLMFLLYLLNSGPRKAASNNANFLVKDPLSPSLPDIELVDVRDHEPERIAQKFSLEENTAQLPDFVANEAPKQKTASDSEPKSQQEYEEDGSREAKKERVSEEQFSDIVASQYAALNFDAAPDVEEPLDTLDTLNTGAHFAAEETLADISPNEPLDGETRNTSDLEALDEEDLIDLPVDEDELRSLKEIENKLLALRQLYKAGLIAPEIYAYKSHQIAQELPRR